EARGAIAKALRMKTQDASILFHAAVIESSLGNRMATRRYLEQSLAINSKFHPAQADEARALLKSIAR
ncbi:MAG TPA: hypothetical protein VHM24_05305, partial [Gemmatimonadaceae bacterium]|nr:hypothetical protein [Gemmatimonadaceae bacterium]